MRAKTSLRDCPGHARTKIKLQRKKGAAFKTIATKKLNKRCKASFRVKASFRKRTFRAVWPKQDDDHSKGRSKPVTVRTHR